MTKTTMTEFDANICRQEMDLLERIARAIEELRPRNGRVCHYCRPRIMDDIERENVHYCPMCGRNLGTDITIWYDEIEGFREVPTVIIREG